MARKNPSGEWWIDDSGSAEFADGDVGDVNHEMLAFASALGIDADTAESAGINPDNIDYDQLGLLLLQEHGERADETEIRQMSAAEWKQLATRLKVPPARLKSKERLYNLGIQWLVDHDANMEFIEWRQNHPQSDARLYAVQNLGWVRVHGNNFETWELTDKVLRNIQNAEEIWDSEGSGDWDAINASDEKIYIEERKTGKLWTVPQKVLLAASGASDIREFLSEANNPPTRVPYKETVQDGALYDAGTERIESSGVVSVLVPVFIDSLHFLPDNRMYQARVDQYTKKPPTQAPQVVRSRKLLVILDGHHRVAAAAQRGEKTILVWLRDIQPWEYDYA